MTARWFSIAVLVIVPVLVIDSLLRQSPDAGRTSETVAPAQPLAADQNAAPKSNDTPIRLVANEPAEAADPLPQAPAKIEAALPVPEELPPGDIVIEIPGVDEGPVFPGGVEGPFAPEGPPPAPPGLTIGDHQGFRVDGGDGTRVQFGGGQGIRIHGPLGGGLRIGGGYGFRDGIVPIDD